MATYAIATEVATRLGLTFDAVQTNQANALLEDVSAFMRARIRKVAGVDLDVEIAAGRVDTAVAKGVCCQVAMLAIDVAETGPAKQGETYPERSVQIRVGAAAELYLTDTQVDLLTPTTTDERGKAFSVHPG
ncbi:Gp19/Gp15/Gp42 family protein [Amycolatopsis sp. NPDC059657]|uniref:Gp19/Gp15/Gp42 family protein n=1 Tax=Amycolatopsis sp. NPDC059657 TaxID=3346899 RepID=UPI00367292FE